MMRLCGLVLAGFGAMAAPAGAQEHLSRFGHVASGEELEAALDANEPAALAFISGAIGVLHLRGGQGDPMLWWVPQCLTVTFAGAEDLVPAIRAQIEAQPDVSGVVGYAATAVLHGLADFCADALGEGEVTVPE